MCHGVIVVMVRSWYVQYVQWCVLVGICLYVMVCGYFVISCFFYKATIC